MGNSKRNIKKLNEDFREYFRLCDFAQSKMCSGTYRIICDGM